MRGLRHKAASIESKGSFSCLSRWACLVLVASIGAGCASLGGVQERYVACPYDRVWKAALSTMEEHPLTVSNRGKGLIRTDWVETRVQGRPYGLFSREGLGDKERFRTTLLLARKHAVTVIHLSERRQHWGFRGGSRIYQWYPVEPSQSALRGIMSTLTTQLEQHGCVVD